MKKIIFALLLTASMHAANAQTWKVDKSNTRLGFSAVHLLISEVHGSFTNFDLKLSMQHATSIARDMVEVFGMGGDEVGVSRYRTTSGEPTRRTDLSPAQLEMLDRRVHALLEEARGQAAAILRANRVLVETLRDMLVEQKVIEAKSLQAMVKAAKKK